MGKVVNIGRASMEDAITTFYKESMHDTDDRVEFEIEHVVEGDANIVGKMFGLASSYDYLHSIRVVPPLPLEFYSDGVKILESTDDEKGLEFPDPLPRRFLGFTHLKYCISPKAQLAAENINQPYTFVLRVSMQRFCYNHIYTVTLSNGKVYSIDRGILVEDDSSTRKTHS